MKGILFAGWGKINDCDGSKIKNDFYSFVAVFINSN
jgi:hypothetical protein